MSSFCRQPHYGNFEVTSLERNSVFLRFAETHARLPYPASFKTPILLVTKVYHMPKYMYTVHVIKLYTIFRWSTLTDRRIQYIKKCSNATACFPTHIHPINRISNEIFYFRNLNFTEIIWHRISMHSIPCPFSHHSKLRNNKTSTNRYITNCTLYYCHIGLSVQ